MLVGVLIGAVVVVIARRTGSVSHDPLSATTPAHAGSQAVVPVLAPPGVTSVQNSTLVGSFTFMA